MFQRTYVLRVALLIVFSMVLGCSKSVRYGDPKGIETVSIEFGSTDLHKVAEEMTRSMLVSQLVVEGNRPLITVLKTLRVNTSIHVRLQIRFEPS